MVSNRYIHYTYLKGRHDNIKVNIGLKKIQDNVLFHVWYTYYSHI